MKTYNFITILICLNIFSLNINKIFGQATTANGTNLPVGGGDFLGWASSANAALVIKNEDPEPLNFYTNSGNASLNNLRMTIFDAPGSPAPANAGYVGIGIASPNNLLHLKKSGTGDAVYTQWTNGNATHTNGLWIGINTSNAGEINMKDHKALNFYTSDKVQSSKFKVCQGVTSLFIEFASSWLKPNFK